MRAERVEIKRDKEAASERAAELRVQELSLRQIGSQLLSEGIFPPRASQWYAATVMELLRYVESRSASMLRSSSCAA